MVNEEKKRLGEKRNCIRELFEYGLRRAAEVGRENVLDFSLGNPSVPSPKGVNEAIADIVRTKTDFAIHGYTPATGTPAARKAVADDLNDRFGCGARPEDLFLTCGAAPALTAVLGALSVEGAEVLILAPYFPEYTVFVRSTGMKSVIVPAADDLRLHVERIAPYITRHTAAVIVNSPNNPSGIVYNREELSALAALLEDKSKLFGHPIRLIADEPYRELVYDGVEVPFLPLLYRNTVVCYSWSKALSLPGERIGYVYVPSRADESAALYAAVAGAARSQGHICAPSLMQHMIERCAVLRPDIEAYDRNRRTLYEELCSYGYDCIRPEGAFYMMIRSPKGSAREFSERAKAKDLLIVPCDDFGCPDCLRLGTCVSYETVVKSLPVFKELMEECKSE